MAALIAAQRDQHRIPHAAACRALGVSRSWLYKHKDGQLPPRAAPGPAQSPDPAAVRDAQRHLRLSADLKDAGWRVSENTVAGLMREQGLAARRQKRRKATTRPGRGR